MTHDELRLRLRLRLLRRFAIVAPTLGPFEGHRPRHHRIVGAVSFAWIFAGLDLDDLTGGF